MDWVRGNSIGHGSFSTVNLAIPRNDSGASLMAVKSCDVFDSVFLENEKDVLDQLGDCEHIIRCFGSEESVENGHRLSNLLLEYAAGGSLAHWVKNNGGCLRESDVRHYTRSVLKGLSYIHAKGFAHCDLKLQNLLLFEDGELKIADFGLAKKVGQKLEGVQVRGTPLCMAPESVNENEYDSPCDIWALGCAVVEMITGKPAWNCRADANIAALLIKIGVSDELPEIPQELSNEGKDFLSKCFVKDPQRRWTADMLLDHSFVADHYDDEFNSTTTVTFKNKKEVPSSSPRCPFEFQEWISIPSSSPNSEVWSHRELESRIDWSSLSSTPSSSPVDRIQQLTSDHQGCNWAFSDSWITVR
ncbi:ATP binding protein, putative [Ricinus communis]|uniref:ATP binding protein, putative n=2 Tax=Ricinus communis TaxID=3988 RepID=B9SC81_RICCO|nr:ATP binding protein, putative [Ricinus communis]